MPRVRHILPDSIQYAGVSSSGEADGEHIVATKNRWSRVVFHFGEVAPDVWCEFSFQIHVNEAEDSQGAHDFASVGVDFLTQDGSSIDFPYVPGLVRAQIDPYHEFIGGPDHGAAKGGSTRTKRVHCNFLVPAPARQLALSIRGWRNSQPFRITHASLRQFVQPSTSNQAEDEAHLQPAEGEREASSRIRRNWRALSSAPHWLSYAIVPGRRLFVRGQIIADHASKEGALVRVVFRNVQGEELPPPYPETLMTPAIGAFIGIPTHMQARRFTLELVPPPQATSVDLGFQTARDDVSMELITPLEISLENSLLVENILGEDTPDAAAFLTQFLQKVDLPTPNGKNHAAILDAVLDKGALSATLKVHQSLRAVQYGDKQQETPGQLRFGTFPDWPLPDHLSWNEDPFRSPAWRLEFHSLSWLLTTVREPKGEQLANAVDRALSWSRASYGEESSDTVSAHPLSTAIRAEALLELLAMIAASDRKMDLRKVIELTGEVVRHGFTLSEIVSQNIFSYSIHQIHAAGSLLSLAKALPRVPLSAYWRSLALAALREGFDQLLAQDGTFFEKSQHHRLELLSLGLILSTALDKDPDAYDLRQNLAPRLRKAALAVISLTDPAGMLPPFGDMDHGQHHASWIRRLISQFGQDWLKNKTIRTELTYPQGARTFALPHMGVLAVRNYQPGKEWSYLCAAITEQRQSHEHWDSTSFVYSAGGVRWITDTSGSSQHEFGAARQYLVASRAHNVALPDGREQTAGTSWLRSQSSVDDIDIFEIASNVNGPDYIHRRIFMMTKGLGAVAVFDHFTTSHPSISIEGFLHFEPEVMAAIANSHLVMAFRGQRRLRIIPHVVVGRLTGIDIIHGSNTRPASLQGFISRRSGALEPASVLRYTVAGQESVCGGVMMAMDRQSLAALTKIIEAHEVRKLLT